MTRLSITVNEELLEEARRLTKSRTKRETIERALTELIQRQRIAKLIALAGSDIINMDLDELLRQRQMSASEE